RNSKLVHERSNSASEGKSRPRPTVGLTVDRTVWPGDHGSSMPTPRVRSRRWGWVAAFAVAYVVVARLALQLDAVGGFAAPVWPRAGMALAAATLLGGDAIIAVALGAFVVNASIGAPPLAAAGIVLGNSLEAVAGAWALRRIGRATLGLGRLRAVLALVLLAA